MYSLSLICFISKWIYNKIYGTLWHVQKHCLPINYLFNVKFPDIGLKFIRNRLEKSNVEISWDMKMNFYFHNNAQSMIFLNDILGLYWDGYDPQEIAISSLVFTKILWISEVREINLNSFIKNSKTDGTWIGSLAYDKLNSASQIKIIYSNCNKGTTASLTINFTSFPEFLQHQNLNKEAKRSEAES